MPKLAVAGASIPPRKHVLIRQNRTFSVRFTALTRQKRGLGRGQGLVSFPPYRVDLQSFSGFHMGFFPEPVHTLSAGCPQLVRTFVRDGLRMNKPLFICRLYAFLPSISPVFCKKTFLVFKYRIFTSKDAILVQT